jgi:chaperonin cofactor prefoldin
MKPTTQKFLAELEKLKSKKHEFELRESEVDTAISDFMTYRQEIDFIIKNKLPDLQALVYDMGDTLDSAMSGLTTTIETFKSVQEDYRQKADELGLDVEIIPEYGYIDTRIFESEQQLELAVRTKDEIIAINNAIRI